VADQEGIEGIKSRLDNIRSVEPILGAMRTISLGSWQAALNRQGSVHTYSERLLALLPALISHVHAHSTRGRLAAGGAPPATIQLTVIGSERGLCGAFNSSLTRHVEQALEAYEQQGIRSELSVLGSRARRTLERLGVPITWSKPLPMTTLPTGELAHALTQTWLERYETHELDGVDLLYNAYHTSTHYEATVTRLIPPPAPSLTTGVLPWPPPYVDTAPIALYTRIAVLWTTAELYRILLSSAASEHSARFQLMEGATQNSNRLINELVLVLQSARQQAITAEMQEIAAGAGLLGGQPI